VEPRVSFITLGVTDLARESLADDAGVPVAGSGFRSFPLAHNVRSPAEVDTLLPHV